MRAMSSNDQKTPFASALVQRTAATLPPGTLKLQIEHKGSEQHGLFMAIASMIELSQQPSQSTAGLPVAQQEEANREAAKRADDQSRKDKDAAKQNPSGSKTGIPGLG